MAPGASTVLGHQSWQGALRGEINQHVAKCWFSVAKSPTSSSSEASPPLQILLNVMQWIQEWAKKSDTLPCLLSHSSNEGICLSQLVLPANHPTNPSEALGGTPTPTPTGTTPSQGSGHQGTHTAGFCLIPKAVYEQTDLKTNRYTEESASCFG